MARCPECDATHDDACTYVMCPRKFRHHARQHGPKRLGFQRADVNVSFHTAANATNPGVNPDV